MDPNQALALAQVFELDPRLLGVVLVRTLIVYFILLAGIRFSGKRELGQMTPFDLVVLLVISNAVQNAMVGPDTSLTAGVVAAFTLLGINWVMNRTAIKYAWLGRRLVGSPTLLINDGHLIESHLRAEGISADEVMMALREHGVSDIQEVMTAILEVDGSISVVPMEAAAKRTRHRFRGRKPMDQ